MRSNHRVRDGWKSRAFVRFWCLCDGLVLDDDDEWNVQTGIYSGYDADGTRSVYIPEETGFVAKFNPTTKNWQTLSGNWGDGDDVHDLVMDDSYYYYISGCSGDLNYLRKYDFSGQLEWTRTFGNECDTPP